MNDRELLELAAKAVNHGVLVDSSGKVCGSYNKDAGPNLFGNPLNDDGDALRLAVKLSMLCEFSCSGMTVEAPKGPGPVSEFEDYRRAIVRAAAEIGKAMQQNQSGPVAGKECK